MKRTALKRRKPLQRLKRTSPSSRKGKNKYARRERAPQAWWDFVRSRRCAVSLFGAPKKTVALAMTSDLQRWLPCDGPPEANHMGERIAGFGTKALDRTAVCFCKIHHMQWTEYKGLFAGLTHEERREYAAACVEATHGLARAQGVEIPEC